MNGKPPDGGSRSGSSEWKKYGENMARNMFDPKVNEARAEGSQSRKGTDCLHQCLDVPDVTIEVPVEIVVRQATDSVEACQVFEERVERLEEEEVMKQSGFKSLVQNKPQRATRLLKESPKVQNLANGVE